MKYKFKNRILNMARKFFLDFKRLCRYFSLFFSRDLVDSSSPDGCNILIIEVEYGGLGDNLFYSHIPRLAKKSGRYDSVYFSNISPFHNQKHKEMIWGMNPYVDGYFNGFGDTYRERLERKKLLDEKFISDKSINILDKIMIAFDLDDGEKFHSPELYYVPKKNKLYENVTIFDPNFITPLYDASIIYNQIEKYIKSHNVNIDMQFIPRNKLCGLVNCSKFVTDRSFEEFCDIIFSCKEIYCFASGTAVLAEALGRKANVFYVGSMDPAFLFSKKHNYIKLS